MKQNGFLKKKTKKIYFYPDITKEIPQSAHIHGTTSQNTAAITLKDQKWNDRVRGENMSEKERRRRKKKNPTRTNTNSFKRFLPDTATGQSQPWVFFFL